MIEEKSFCTYKNHIDFINESNQLTIVALYDLQNNEINPGHNKRLAQAICHIQSSIKILKTVEEDIMSILLRNIKDE